MDAVGIAYVTGYTNDITITPGDLGAAMFRLLSHHGSANAVAESPMAVCCKAPLAESPPSIALRPRVAFADEGGCQTLIPLGWGARLRRRSNGWRSPHIDVLAARRLGGRFGSGVEASTIVSSSSLL